jgi:hypothetical protein
MPIEQFGGIKSPRSDESCIDNAGQRWHYNFAEKTCILVDFSGCFGTDNLFDDEAACKKFCDDVPDLLANDPKEPIRPHLHIYAPNDQAIENALISGESTDEFFRKDNIGAGMSLIAKSISHQACTDEVEAITAIDGSVINCKGTKKLFSNIIS